MAGLKALQAQHRWPLAVAILALTSVPLVSTNERNATFQFDHQVEIFFNWRRLQRLYECLADPVTKMCRHEYYPTEGLKEHYSAEQMTESLNFTGDTDSGNSLLCSPGRLVNSTGALTCIRSRTALGACGIPGLCDKYHVNLQYETCPLKCINIWWVGVRMTGQEMHMYPSLLPGLCETEEVAVAAGIPDGVESATGISDGAESATTATVTAADSASAAGDSSTKNDSCNCIRNDGVDSRNCSGNIGADSNGLAPGRDHAVIVGTSDGGSYHNKLLILAIIGWALFGVVVALAIVLGGFLWRRSQMGVIDLNQLLSLCGKGGKRVEVKSTSTDIELNGPPIPEYAEILPRASMDGADHNTAPKQVPPRHEDASDGGACYTTNSAVDGGLERLRPGWSGGQSTPSYPTETSIPYIPWDEALRWGRDLRERRGSNPLLHGLEKPSQTNSNC